MLSSKKVRTKLSIALALGLICMQGATLVQAADLENQVRIFAGNKQLNNDHWKSMDSQGEIGVMFDIKKADWPVSIAIDIFVSATDSDTVDLVNQRAYSSEIHLGTRKTWDLNSIDIHPYIGGGIAFIGSGFEQRTALGGQRKDDSAVGGWVSTGAYWNITPRFKLGLDVSYSFAETTHLNQKIDAGGVHSGLTLGFNF